MLISILGILSCGIKTKKFAKDTILGKFSRKEQVP